MGPRSLFGSVDDVVVDKPRPRAAWTLVGGLALTGVVGYILAGWGFHLGSTLTDPLVWLVAAGFVVFEMYTIDLPFKSHRHSFSMAEVPALFGFFYLSPFGLVFASLTGSLVIGIGARRQKGLKLSFNVALQVGTMVVQLIVFEAIAGSRDPTDATAMVAAYVAVTVNSVIGHGAVTAVISMVEGLWAKALFWRGLWFGTASALANASMGLMTVLLVDFDWRTIFIVATPIVVMYGAYWSMGKRMVAEEQLRASERRFTALVHASSDITALVGADGILQYVSDAAAELLGVDPTEMRGVPAHTLFGENPEIEEKFKSIFEGVVQGEGAVGMNLPAHRPDGSEIELEVHLTNLLSDEGVQAVLLSARDVTVRRQLEERLTQAQKMDAIGQLAGGIAHDFNNLLAVIQNYATFIKSDLPEGSESAGDVDEIMKATDTASSLTRQLLSFARKEMVRPQVVDVNDVMMGMHRMFSRTIEESIELATSFLPNLPPVKIDPVQLEQVLINLAVNAKDAMPDGGTLSIRTYESFVGAPLASSDLPKGEYVVLSVSDTGTGIPDHVRPRLFEPFFTTKPKGEGTGLGLATVYGIVKQFRGHIEVESELGVGTTFKIYLPASTEPVHVPAAVRGEAPPGARGTILVAEDSDPLRKMVVRILSNSAYDVVAAPSGVEALRLWEEQPDGIDLLLTDVVMPQMSGRELSDLTGLPTVFISGYTDQILSQADVAGGDRFLQKPFSSVELLGVVAEALS